MLIEFKVANFRSFRDEQTLSMVASEADQTHQANLVRQDGFALVKAAAVYGPNASGKSNLISALQCVQTFVGESASRMNLEDEIPGISPFRLDQAYSDRPSSFEVQFTTRTAHYRYGFSASHWMVCEEWLFVREPRVEIEKLLFSRECNPSNGKTCWEFGEPLAGGDRDIIEKRTRENGLALSRGAELNVGPLLEPFRWFRNELRVQDLSQNLHPLVRDTVRRMGDPEFKRHLISMLQHADLGIKNIVIVEGPWEQRPLIPLTRATAEEGSVFAVHSTNTRDSTVDMDFFRDESLGTQRFLVMAGFLLSALTEGQTLVLDEFDCSLHPLLARKLIELFQSEDLGKAGGQLIFATHDSTLMDPVLFRRDQIWLVEKNALGGSELCSVHDFDVSSERPTTASLQRDYLAGRFGAVPRFGPTFEDLKLKPAGANE
ncbi:MAG: ATP-binding protein [Planctomycetes bacterium]|nr:ATP-binding protein [Planctomycetota bacterium]